MSFKQWLQVFRAQTAPATLLFILTPYLHNAEFFDVKTLVIAVTAVIIHYLSFGHNSLIDTSQGYDLKDPSKRHHPLLSGAISLTAAHNVIHWGLIMITAFAGLYTLWLSPNPSWAIFFLLMCFVFGMGYNNGLSKESIIGFLAISICFTAMGAWAWLLSHEWFGELGLLWLAYVFFTLLFQISWSGFIKEIGIEERSNILHKMGAHLDVVRNGKPSFRPGMAIYYGAILKLVNIALIVPMILINYKRWIWVWYVVLSSLAIFYAYRLLVPRVYDRGKELMNMSLMEIFTIFLPIPVILQWLEATVLMTSGILYFFLINKILWGKPYPRV